ncbi:Kinesin-like protein kif15 [Haplosporangium sp. Z 767]|nr:Kinesin-like protein kif15 [Haplosporangium sp. Z 767]KAF9180842.1 Kinesin-like protein kif15 [Haplosporangium sp. Z 11]
MFMDVGKTIVEQCVKGYNGTIFAYGQTGSGKTYTMQGPSTMTSVGNHKERGIIPRCLEYLFELIAKEEQMVSSVKYLCKASYIEIYNEMIYDLLDNSTTARATREDIKRGVYVDGVTEESIHNPDDAYKLFEHGAVNRHISATAMNRESSRSHTVLTLTIQSMALVDGINHIRESRFNLVDLAGSERQKQANTEGLRLKEAGNINKSLLCLGSVINALGEIAGGHSRHVHYRDSRLTFLLKDSLGGNSNTFIVANVSPSALCYQESLSTLRFAQRAKMIRNKAVVNEDIQGNVNELRAEIHRLKAELALKQAMGFGEDTSVTNKLLMETLAKLRTEQEEHLAMAQKSFMLDDACKAREKQIQSAQLIIKFKESAVVAYRKGITNAALDSEKAALQEEITQLKKQLDFHPEVLRVKAENLRMQEMLLKYEKYQTSLEDYEEKQKKEKEYLYNLSGKILELEQENETLRSKLGYTTPKSNIDAEEIDFPRIDGIDDIMQESPPKVRDADRRFSSDMKSLIQRVAQNRKAEYRRLSGNLGKPEHLLDGTDYECIGSSPLSGSATAPHTPLRKIGVDSKDSVAGVNLSDGLSANSTMHSEDTVEMTLLKRDVDRLKDENSMLVDEKTSLEKEFADSQFQLITMEKCLEQATNQAEQLGHELQSSRHSLSTMEQEATRKIMDLTKEMQEQVELMENMRQTSILVEEELNRLNESHREVEQQLKSTSKDLDDTRQRLLENQKEYDHQVEYNMKRINDFQEKESKWDETKTEILKAKEELEKQLEQERARTSSTRSELEKEHRKLQQDCELLGSEKQRLEDLQSSLEKELEKLRQTSADAAKEHEARFQQALKEYEIAVKMEQAQKEALETELSTVQALVEKLEKEHEMTKQALESKKQEAEQTFQEREQQAMDTAKGLEEKHLQDLEEYKKQAGLEAEESMRVMRQSLLEAHELEIKTLKTEAEEHNRALEEARSSLKQSIEEVEKALETRQKLTMELDSVRELHRVLGIEAGDLKQERCRLESQIESMTTKCQKLELTLEEQKQALNKMDLQLQQEKWEKERLETTKSELREKVTEMAHKIGEMEQKLEQARDDHRTLEMEYRTVQDELEHRLTILRNELSIKTSENRLNEEYKRKFRELKAQFADLGPTVTERQQQGFHERELKRIMELEKIREEMNQEQTRSVQLEASLALAQETNEQLLEDAKANTMKIAEEMEKRLREVDVQRQNAEREVEQALETVQLKTAELQALEEKAMTQQEQIQALEEELSEERVRVERLEGSLSEGKAMLEEQEATEKELLVQETKRKLKEEQLMAQRQLLIKMKEEQQALVKQQLERRDKTRALFEGLATENGKLIEQVRDLGIVNESMMKHQNPKQKLQYHVKIKQENNELRIENQRLMFRAIELEERLGNKENVESLRKQVWEMHGKSPYMSSLDLKQEDDIDTETRSTGMDMGKSLDSEMSIQRSDSSSPALSSEASSFSAATTTSKTPLNGRARSQTPSAVGQKRKAAISDVSSAAHLAAGRKRPVTTQGAHSAASTPLRQRALSTSSTVSSTSSAVIASTSRAGVVADVPLGPRARAKAAADAALAASKFGRSISATPAAKNAPSKPVNPISRVTRTPTQRPLPKPVTDPLRGSRSGGAVMKPKDAVSSSSTLSSTVKATSATATRPSGPIIGSASAQRALAREARLAAAAAAAASTGAAISSSRKGLTNQTNSQANVRGASQEPARSTPAPSPAPSSKVVEKAAAATPSTTATMDVTENSPSRIVSGAEATEQ